MPLPQCDLVPPEAVAFFPPVWMREGGRRNGGRKSSGEQYRTVMDVCALNRVLSNLALTVLPSTQSVRIPAAEDPAPQRNDRCVAEIEKWHSVAHQLQSTAGISANKDT